MATFYSSVGSKDGPCIKKKFFKIILLVNILTHTRKNKSKLFNNRTTVTIKCVELETRRFLTTVPSVDIRRVVNDG